MACVARVSSVNTVPHSIRVWDPCSVLSKCRGGEECPVEGNGRHRLWAHREMGRLMRMYDGTRGLRHARTGSTWHYGGGRGTWA